MICQNCNKRPLQTQKQCVHCGSVVKPDGEDQLSRDFGADKEEFKSIVTKSLIAFELVGLAGLGLYFYANSAANEQRMLSNGCIPDYLIEICERGMNKAGRDELSSGGYELSSRRSVDRQTTIDHLFGVNECWSLSQGPTRPTQSSLPDGARIKIEWSEPA